jgi:membrane protein
VHRTALDKARFVWHDITGFLRRVYEGADEANVAFLASGLAFDALLAAIPFLFLIVSVAGYVLSAQADRAQLEVHDYLRRFLPDAPPGVSSDPFSPAVELLVKLVGERDTFSLVGFPLFVWLSTRLFGSLRAALNEVFDVEDRRGWIKGKAEDVVMVFIVTILFVVNTALGQGVEIATTLIPAIGFAQYFIAQVLAFFALVTLFVLVFRYAPARRIRRDTAVIAALICAFGFELARFFLGLYIGHLLSPSRIVRDATIAALLLFVVWTYYMAFVFLIGGQIAQERLLLG